MDNLPPPDVIAQEIVEDLEAALAQFSAVALTLTGRYAAHPGTAELTTVADPP